MKYLLLALLISTSAYTRDPYMIDNVRSITFDDDLNEMTVKLMDDPTKTYTLSQDTKVADCLKDGYQGQIRVKIHFTSDGDSIKNCLLIPRGNKL